LAARSQKDTGYQAPKTRCLTPNIHYAMHPLATLLVRDSYCDCLLKLLDFDGSPCDWSMKYAPFFMYSALSLLWTARIRLEFHYHPFDSM